MGERKDRPPEDDTVPCCSHHAHDYGGG
jgi:hypothetical protein